MRRATEAQPGAAQAHEIDQALARLTGIGRTGMGTLFKVMAFTHRDLPVPPGFEH